MLQISDALSCQLEILIDARPVVRMHMLNEPGEAPLAFRNRIAIAKALVMADRAAEGVMNEIQVPIPNLPGSEREFEGRPDLLKLDPIYQSVPDPAARERLVCAFDIEATVPERALGYRFDIVLRGPDQTPMEK